MYERLETALDEEMRIHLFGRCACGVIRDVRGIFEPDGEVFCPGCGQSAGPLYGEAEPGGSL